MLQLRNTHTVKVPEHIYQRIINGTTSLSAAQLLVYLRKLSANKKGSLLGTCVWQSLSDGHIHDTSSNNGGNDSFAQSLDLFQQELSRYKTRRITFCAINVNTRTEFEHLVSYSLLASISLAFLGGRVRVGPSERKCDFQDLLGIVLEEHWNDCSSNIEEVIRETSKRSISPPQLAWALTLSSNTNHQNTSLQYDPATQVLSFRGLDIELQWMSEPLELNTFLGIHDWNIYISEPYTRRPALEVLRFVDMTAQGNSNGQAVITTTSSRVLRRLKNNIDTAVNTKAIDMSSPDIEDVLYSHIVVFLTSVLDDAVDNFLQSVARAQELVCFQNCHANFVAD